MISQQLHHSDQNEIGTNDRARDFVNRVVNILSTDAAASIDFRPRVNLIPLEFDADTSKVKVRCRLTDLEMSEC